MAEKIKKEKKVKADGEGTIEKKHRKDSKKEGKKEKKEKKQKGDAAAKSFNLLADNKSVNPALSSLFAVKVSTRSKVLSRMQLI